MTVLPVAATSFDLPDEEEGRITRAIKSEVPNGSKVDFKKVKSSEIESLERQLELSHGKLAALKEKEAFIGSRLEHYRLQLGDLVYSQHYDAHLSKQQEDERTMKEKSDFLMLRTISKSHKDTMHAIDGLEKRIQDMEDHKMHLGTHSIPSQKAMHRNSVTPLGALSISSLLFLPVGLFFVSVPLMYCAGISYQRQRNSSGNKSCAFGGWILYVMSAFTALALTGHSDTNLDCVRVITLSAVLGLISWILMAIHAESARRL